MELTDNLTGEFVRIGFYDPQGPIAADNFSADDFTPHICADSRAGTDTRLPGTIHSVPQLPGNQMIPDMDGFLGLGLTAVTRAIDSTFQWAVIDELGYLESSCPEFCDAVFRLFDQKHVIAVLRSQSTPFLDALQARDDVFMYDLDHPVLPVGCVIMASGLGKRYFEELLTLPDNHGGNVLLKKYPDAVRYFPACSLLELADADTPAELEQLKKAESAR